MAISLKNLENRVTTLEEQSSSGTSVCKKLCDSTGVLSEPMTNFDILSISVTYRGNPYSNISIPVTMFKSQKTVKWDERGGQDADRAYGGEFKYISDTQIGTGSGYATLGAVWGLKLYYNFSYNITYKIYTSYKFQLKSIFDYMLRFLGLEVRLTWLLV